MTAITLKDLLPSRLKIKTLDSEDKKICPKCGKKSMIQKQVKDHRYIWSCVHCDTQRGPFKKDTKVSVV